MLYDIIREDEYIMQSIIDVFDRRDSGMRTCLNIDKDDAEWYVVIAPSDYSDNEVAVAIVDEVDPLGNPADSYVEYEYFDESDIEQIRNILEG